MQCSVAVRADDGEVFETADPNAFCLSHRRRVVTLRESLAQRPVHFGEVELADLASQLVVELQNACFLVRYEFAIALNDSVLPEESPAFYIFRR